MFTCPRFSNRHSCSSFARPAGFDVQCRRDGGRREGERPGDRGLGAVASEQQRDDHASQHRGEDHQREEAHGGPYRKGHRLVPGLIDLLVDERPQLTDLRESGSIEQDANIVMLVHRPS